MKKISSYFKKRLLKAGINEILYEFKNNQKILDSIKDLKIRQFYLSKELKNIKKEINSL